MASLDDVVSNLKNVVTNLSGLATATGVINTLGAINTTLIGIGTALATVHSFGGSIFFPKGATAVVVSNASIGAGAFAVFSPGDLGSYTIQVEDGVYGGPSAGAFTLTIPSPGTATLTGTFQYVGFNP